MYLFSRIIPLLSLLLFTACVEPNLKNPYINTIAKNLAIEHVFVPPSTKHHPYSLLHYSEKSGYSVLCSASILSGIAEENLSKEIKENNISNTKIAINKSLEFGVSLSKADVGSTNIGYQNIKFLMINLTNGKEITMPSMHMYTALKNLKNSECKEDILIYKNSHPDSKYYIPKTIYRYTISSTVLDQNHFDITAQVPSSLKQLIFARASAKAGSIGNMDFSGENLYIGFNGIIVTHKVSSIVPKGITPKDAVFDVTEMIQKIQQEK